jgi:hypothetical protein
VSNAAWFEDEKSNVKDRARDEVPLDAEVFQAPIVRQVDDDIAGLAAVAKSAGPRDLEEIARLARQVGAALGRVLDAKGEGTRAYYRWSVNSKDGGKSVIEGPTVDLMDALAGVWGGLLYQIRLISETGQRVHLRGRVLDLVRVVAHERDYLGHLRPAPGRFAGEEAERWKVMQLQAAESKAIRGVLEHVIPAWVVEEAMEAARDAAAKARTGGKPVDEASKAALAALDKQKIDADLAARWVGKPVAQWNAYDLQALRDLFARAKRGEITPDGVRVEAAAREAERKAEEDGSAPPPAQDQGTGGADRLSGLGLGKGGASGEPKASETPKADPKDEKPKRPRASKGEPKDAAPAKSDPPANTTLAPSSAPPATTKPLEGLELVEAIKAAESELENGVEAVRRGMGLSMALSAANVVERVGAEEGRLYLQRLQNAIDNGSQT